MERLAPGTVLLTLAPPLCSWVLKLNFLITIKSEFSGGVRYTIELSNTSNHLLLQGKCKGLEWGQDSMTRHEKYSRAKFHGLGILWYWEKRCDIQRGCPDAMESAQGKGQTGTEVSRHLLSFSLCHPHCTMYISVSLHYSNKKKIN